MAWGPKVGRIIECPRCGAETEVWIKPLPMDDVVVGIFFEAECPNGHRLTEEEMYDARILRTAAPA